MASLRVRLASVPVLFARRMHSGALGQRLYRVPRTPVGLSETLAKTQGSQKPAIRQGKVENCDFQGRVGENTETAGSNGLSQAREHPPEQRPSPQGRTVLERIEQLELLNEQRTHELQDERFRNYALSARLLTLETAFQNADGRSIVMDSLASGFSAISKQLASEMGGLANKLDLLLDDHRKACRSADPKDANKDDLDQLRGRVQPPKEEGCPSEEISRVECELDWRVVKLEEDLEDYRLEIEERVFRPLLQRVSGLEAKEEKTAQQLVTLSESQKKLERRVLDLEVPDVPQASKAEIEKAVEEMAKLVSEVFVQLGNRLDKTDEAAKETSQKVKQLRKSIFG
ncbi:hypothetical protein FN846DRAFT_1025730 [Sphaerosporella brunnea]|uniref:Uncharacterized protein n=1 Tax=Sphaerosporella brunnea TaxID=1250544 RepID=A0A5J5EDE1_9PEZI|nr:hypothetical protein FN846DRAFT_1025730 [Sphaerosporella brunnea]